LGAFSTGDTEKLGWKWLFERIRWGKIPCNFLPKALLN